jgi:hypothetical protein
MRIQVSPTMMRLRCLFFVLCCAPLAQAEPMAFEPGAYIVDLGGSPQTEENALQPYGMVYEFLDARVPVMWAFQLIRAVTAT